MNFVKATPPSSRHSVTDIDSPSCMRDCNKIKIARCSMAFESAEQLNNYIYFFTWSDNIKYSMVGHSH